MRNLIIYLIGAFSVFAQSVEYEINYKIDFNTDFPRSFISTLYVNQSQSFYYYVLDYSNFNSDGDIDNNGIIISNSKNSDNLIVLNKLNGDILSQEQTFTETYKIKDKIAINWTLSDETKKIDNYTVKKARTEFRGRSYTAWYSEEIPITMGPYKFYNLPGLILEVYDDDDKFHWTITSLKKINKELDIDVFKDEDEFISMKEFVSKKDKAIENLTNNLNSRLPRDVTVSNVQRTVFKRKGIEIEFEWEKE